MDEIARAKEGPPCLPFSATGIRKSHKIFLYAQGEELLIGRSVDTSLSRAAKYDPLLENKRLSWSSLDGYYIPTRYANGLPDSIPSRVFNAKLARYAVNLAEEAVSLISELLRRKQAT